MYIVGANGSYEWLCYSYELPWQEYKQGHTFEARSVSSKSRIKLGVYDLKTRSDGAKGWRLELQDTGHRTNIQIHRAHKSLYIEGCILPVHIDNLDSSGVNKNDPIIQPESEKLMSKIKSRYDSLKSTKTGNPAISFAAKLPSIASLKKSYA